MTRQKVKFGPSTIYYFVKEVDNSRDWQQIARDRLRFHRRIRQVEKLISQNITTTYIKHYFTRNEMSLESTCP